MTTQLAFNSVLQRRFRVGSWAEQAVSTFRLAKKAVMESRFEDAVELGRYAVEEGEEAHELYPLFIKQARQYLIDARIPPAEVAEGESRILKNLREPNGEEFDFERGWQEFTSSIEAFVQACKKGHSETAIGALGEARQRWRTAHDRACDWVYGMVDMCSRKLGEERVADLWDHMMGPFYGTRDRYDVDRRPWSDSVEALLLDTAETFRGHLSGPGRNGDIEIVEEADRWAIRLDPCGTGGRTYRDDHEGGPPRMLPPYNYAVTTKPHDWSWGKTGVCLYCVHCCQLQERIPIQRFGYPVRVIDPPTWPDAREGGKCVWYIYKDPALIPAAAYERVGFRKPKRLGSKATVHELFEGRKNQASP